MTRPIPGTNRQHRILRVLVEHGALTLTGIRQHIGKLSHADLKVLCEQGYAVEAAKIPPKGPCTIKEVSVFKHTRKGKAYAAVDFPMPEKKEPPNRVQIVITKASKASKATVKLKPMAAVEITYTDNTKFTQYVPKYEFKPYQPPKNFMECIR